MIREPSRRTGLNWTPQFRRFPPSCSYSSPRDWRPPVPMISTPNSWSAPTPVHRVKGSPRAPALTPLHQQSNGVRTHPLVANAARYSGQGRGVAARRGCDKQSRRPTLCHRDMLPRVSDSVLQKTNTGRPHVLHVRPGCIPAPDAARSSRRVTGHRVRARDRRIRRRESRLRAV